MSVFDSLMIHTCSVLQASTTTDMGHTIKTWTGAGITTTTGIPCRLQRMDMLRNMAVINDTGAVIGDFALWMPYDDAPSVLKSYSSEDVVRITNVVDQDGVSIDAGPFFVTEIIDAAGEHQHIKLVLRRTA